MLPTVSLPLGVTVLQSAAACRVALEEFASLDPTPHALGRWLSTRYRAALAGACEQFFTLRDSSSIECAIEDAQRELACMRKEARRPGSDFIANLPQRVNIVRVRDGEGRLGFAPTDVPGMSLTARVLSIFLADFLARPEHYVSAA